MTTSDDSRGWKVHRGWLVRTRSRTGAEGKQKFVTYREAVTEARRMASTRRYREVWVDENDVVARAFRDLDPTRKPRKGDEGRRHVMEVESD